MRIGRLAPLPPAVSFFRRLRRDCTARNLRLASGLVMAFFVATHLLNHALGLVSLEVMEAGTDRVSRVLARDPRPTRSSS